MQSAYAIFKVVELSKLAKSEITRTQNQSRKKLYFLKLRKNLVS